MKIKRIKLNEELKNKALFLITKELLKTKDRLAFINLKRFIKPLYRALSLIIIFSFL